ncbi:methionine/alanine import family NSS transporter small subunit [Alkanindiges illinoisensis]|uniref:Methionine/alanine import family NSS transporter small subunit n=1 Tax=Alkanindiges illinoisensis TaxID=197183 RepID=A0A4Y7XAZ5_9GAMM|nr:methionine/alanine import family NSS transporter small subunit [Alkanindiges illinoisensis]TEU25576.1 methionine/alanine import family NSS transporter small subunit [Alkanindiges illinoisensis]
MNSSAVFMMILSIVLLWGGLLAAIIHLSHHPDE